MRSRGGRRPERKCPGLISNGIALRYTKTTLISGLVTITRLLSEFMQILL